MNSKKSLETEIAPKKKSSLRENTEAILVAVVLALFIRTFVVQAFKIPSGSMKETLQIGDHILVNKFIYGVKLPFLQTTLIPLSQPGREDIIVFKYPGDPGKDFIKRVVGIAGDVIEIRDKKLYVNNVPQDPKSYVMHSDPRIFPPGLTSRDNFGPVKVPADSLFVMGDNRDNSHDGRFWGFVNLKAVKGKAFVIYWSWNKEKFKGGGDWLTWWNYVRWNRFGRLLK